MIVLVVLGLIVLIGVPALVLVCRRRCRATGKCDQENYAKLMFEQGKVWELGFRPP